jgi:hypothetical protein
VRGPQPATGAPAPPAPSISLTTTFRPPPERTAPETTTCRSIQVRVRAGAGVSGGRLAPAGVVRDFAIRAARTTFLSCGGSSVRWMAPLPVAPDPDRHDQISPTRPAGGLGIVGRVHGARLHAGDRGRRPRPSWHPRTGHSTARTRPPSTRRTSSGASITRTSRSRREPAFTTSATRGTRGRPTTWSSPIALTKRILGIRSTVVRDTVSQHGKPVERTFDWYAQDKHGNVWYMGEDSLELKGGHFVRASDSWKSGVDGAKPGIIMRGHPRAGDVYRRSTTSPARRSTRHASSGARRP